MLRAQTLVHFALCLFPLLSTLACGGGGDGPGGAGGTGGAGGSGGGGGTGGAPMKTRIAFGSCARPPNPMPVLDLATASNPDLFMFMGDNIYGDTFTLSDLEARYAELAAAPEFKALKAKVPLIATWDDHDYGANDAGKDYPLKVESKALFLDFWEEPADSPRRTREGIYTSYLRQEAGGTVQIILLDMRWFRDALDPVTDPTKYKNDYQPTTDTTRTLLGAEQWAWLETELTQPADVRIIGTSIQFGHEYNGWESWTTMPHERERMIELLKKTGAEATIFVSGDVHWGELSKLTAPGIYPLYDLTSSGITETWPIIEPNANRVGKAISQNNYGYVEIAWGDTDHTITLGLVDKTDTIRVEQVVSTSELRF